MNQRALHRVQTPNDKYWWLLAAGVLSLFVSLQSTLADSELFNANLDASTQGWSSQFTFAAPCDGKLIALVANPDISADGSFSIHDVPVECLIHYRLPTGTGDPPVSFLHPDQGLKASVYEFDVRQSWGTRVYEVNWSPVGTQNTGKDSISIVFQPSSLSNEARQLVGTLTSDPQQSNSASWDVSLDRPGKLIFHTISAGSGGGSHGLYVDGRGVSDSYVGNTAAPTWWSVNLGPGAHNLSLSHEDDYWTDNVGVRSTELLLSCDPARVLVPANCASPWVDTDVDIPESGWVDMTAYGRWSGDGNEWHDANGFGPAPDVFLVPGEPAGGMVARIGLGAPFAVGTAGRFYATDHGTGRLYLAFNDQVPSGGYADNAGALAVDITVIPDPATLLLLALGGLALLRRKGYGG